MSEFDRYSVAGYKVGDLVTVLLPGVIDHRDCIGKQYMIQDIWRSPTDTNDQRIYLEGVPMYFFAHEIEPYSGAKCECNTKRPFTEDCIKCIPEIYP